MDALVNPTNYTFSILCVPFLVAALIVAIASIYVLFLRGARLLRSSFLTVASGGFGLTMSFAVSSVATAPQAAEAVFRLGLALIPISSVGALAFALIISQELSRYRLLLAAAMTLCVPQVVLVLSTDVYIQGVYQTDLGLYHYRAGPLFWLYLLNPGIWMAVSLALCGRALKAEVDQRRRRQLRTVLLAFGLFVMCLSDTPLAYGMGGYPLAWLSLSAGLLLTLRSVLLEERLEARPLDARVPLALLYLIGATVGVWGLWYAIAALPLLIKLALVLLLYAVLRVIIAIGAIVRRPNASLTNSLLDRLVEQYATRVQKLRTVDEIASLSREMLQLGLGCERVDLLLPSRRDYSWRTLSGKTLSEAATPDPLILSWFLDNPGPITGEDLQTRRLGDSREALERLFTANRAELIAPLASRDDMVGMLVIAGFTHTDSLPTEERRFLERIQEYAAVALDYAHMHREANARVELYRQMELAATVQSAFVPDGDRLDFGAVVLSGIWAPASQCGGDWWWGHQLPDGRVLVLIGDVTGHGVSSAMVTAAAKGCYEVAQRLMGADLDVVQLLELLDASVRLVGGDDFHMTCFASLLDPATGQVTYANAGHLVPYTCRPREDGTIKLSVLSARGTPLGAGTKVGHKAHTKTLHDGDLLVWYTDGIVECVNSSGQQFSDRRLQRLLRKLDPATLDPHLVRDQIVRAVLAFQGGLRADDDITLVVARLAQRRDQDSTSD